MVTVTVDVDVEVELSEFSDNEIKSEYVSRNLGKDVTAESCELIIENAFLAARDIPNLPQQIKDLFYKVHGLAMP